jgi:hypothetical protein
MKNQELYTKEQVSELLGWVLKKLDVETKGLPNELIETWVSQNGVKAIDNSFVCFTFFREDHGPYRDNEEDWEYDEEEDEE